MKGNEHMENLFNEMQKRMTFREELLSPNACKTINGIKIREDSKEDIRPIFFKDIDRIIHSLAYTRYIDKTQVYAFSNNDHITHRVLHVQLVSKIARTIGRCLKLNEDLIEAIALGHDLGHTPFGHMGEGFLNEICQREGIGYFCHNAQGVRVLKDIEEINISIQTLDGILAHNGEILLNKYEVDRNKTKEQFLEELNKVESIEKYSKKILPMTLEGSVVRLSDIIAYIGRDIEDAIILGVIKREDLPKEVTEVLGNNNSSIVNTLTLDVIENSIDKPYLAFSKEVFDALILLKNWNSKTIYASEKARENQDIIRNLMNKMFYIYLEKLKNIKNIEESDVLCDFYKNRSEEYRANTPIKKVAIDYIAGATDKFFLNECRINIEEFKNIRLY